MARRNKAMDEKELLAQLDGQISDAESYSGSELSAHREAALKYYDGDMSKDLPSKVGKSSVVSQDVADTIGWILPSLMRVFLAAEHVGIYEPEKPGDEAGAKQATDYVNYTLLREAEGYQVLRSAMFDGLLVGNGILKHWWDAAPEYCTEEFSGLDDMAYTMLVEDDDVEVVEHSAYEGDEPTQPQLDPMTGQPLMAPPAMVHDVKIKRMTRKGRLMIRVVPGEDFLIEREATALNENDCLFCAHRDTPTRSELILRGYDRSVVEDLAVYTDASDKDGEKDAREPLRSASPSQTDHAAERVEVFECYVKVDYDGDGVAEWRQVVMSADSGERRILANEEWGGDLPFTDLVPDPVPHRWRGRSIYDEVGEVQKVKTSLLRRMLDNLYMTLEPNRVINMNAVKNKDAALNLKLGETIQTDQDPRAVVMDLAIPFVGKEAAPMLEYWDQIAERRTGVGNRSAGLDKDTLQNEPTATATNAMQAASYAKQEDYARNIAEMGMKRLFRCLLKLIQKNQDKAKTIRLRDQWVEMDPRVWNANMDVSINVGLGSGSRDRDLQMLAGIKQSQEQILMQMGPTGPLVSLMEYRNTLAKMVEVAGIKTPEQFFREITPEVMQGLAQQAAQPKPDPKMMEAQAKLQIEQGKAQADAQLAQQRAMAELQLSRERSAGDLEAQRESGALKMQLLREETAAKLQLAREEAQVKAELAREEAMMKAQLRREEMMLEAELTAQANAMNADVAMRQADTNINRPGGE
jgi:hypothetical protein